MGRVRILPERLIQSKHTAPPPSPPLDPPPIPDELVSLLVVGNPGAGKTSLVQSFVRHASLTNNNDDGNGTANANGNDVCSTTTRSISSSRRRMRNSDSNDKSTTTKTTGHIHKTTWSVGYHKKDLLFANQHSCLRSLRVQLWDTSGVDVNSISSSSHSSMGKNSMDRAADWGVFWNKASVILVVVSLADPFDQVLRNIKRWSQWCLSQTQQKNRCNKEIVLILHQGDQLLLQQRQQQQHPAYWMELGGRIANLCQQLHIPSWYITSSCLEDDDHNDALFMCTSIDTAFRHILGNKGKPFILKPTSSSALSDSTGTASSVTANDHDDSYNDDDDERFIPRKGMRSLSMKK